MSLPELDMYIHCKECIQDSGGLGENAEPYTQYLEVGTKNKNELWINCKVHKKPITAFKVIAQASDTCDCCASKEGETNE